MGCSAHTSAAAPAACGLAIEVPPIDSNSIPFMDAASTETPGAVTSGRMMLETLV